MVSTAKILAPVITDNACRDQLLVSLDDIVAAVDSFKNHAVARSAENKTAEKATESVLAAIVEVIVVEVVAVHHRQLSTWLFRNIKHLSKVSLKLERRRK